VKDEIAPGEVLRRGILFRDLYWDTATQRIEIGANAFLLRPRDAGELSGYRAALETTEATFQRLPRSEALVELTAQAIRKLGLEVEPRLRPESPAHAVILGLPAPNFQDPNAPESTLAAARAVDLVSLSHLTAHRTQPYDALVQRLIDAGQVRP
jgi:hypothetical protein